MTHIKRGDFAGEVNLRFFVLFCFVLFNVLELFLSFEITPHTSFIKIDQGIPILQLKKDQKLVLLSLLFSECFHLLIITYESPQPQSFPLSTSFILLTLK